MPRTKKEIKCYEIEISGRPYRLSTEEDEPYVHQLAAAVTAQILKLKRETGASPLDCATIAALIFADELNKANDKLEKRTKNTAAANQRKG